MVSSSWWWLPWVALASAAGVVPAVLAWRRGRRASALRWFGWATLPWAAWLLGMVSLVARVADAFADWTTRFVFNPAAWAGIVLALAGVSMVVLGSRLGRRDAPQAPAGRTTAAAGAGRRPQVTSAAEPADDDIEAILRKHGIT